MKNILLSRFICELNINVIKTKSMCFSEVWSALIALVIEFSNETNIYIDIIPLLLIKLVPNPKR